MRKVLSLLTVALLSSCSLSSLNPFKKEEEVKYQTYTGYSVQQEAPKGLKGIKNVVYYMKREFTPLEGEIVLNSYDGFLIDLGKESGVSVGDRFITESGAILKVTQVRKEYSVALPTLGNPMVGEKVEKLLFNRVLYLDFTKRKGKELYRKLKKEVPSLHLAPYEEGERFKEKFHLKFPSDFKRKIPADKLTGYDGYIIVTDVGTEVYDGTKKLLKIFPWEGAPVTSYSLAPGSLYRIVYDFKGKHATSLFAANIDSSPETEIVVSTKNSIKVFRATPYGVKEVYKFKNPFPGSYLFHVCPVELDKSGVFEFIVDGFYQEDKSVSSGLFKVENGKLVRIARTNLITSCFDTDGDGVNDSIFGQEVSSESDKLFGKRVWKLKVSGSKLKKTERVKVPKEFQVTSAQLFKNGGKTYFAYYDLDYYFNVSDGEKLLWRSPIQIGASPNSIYWYNDDILISYYITPKPKPIDADGDGNEEVLFSQNKNAVPGVLRNIYTFDGGRVLLLYRSGETFDWEEATSPVYKLGGIEEFDYLPQYDVFVSIFTEVNILKNPHSKLLFIKPKF
ncbi:hypothetical protein C7457_0468 [Thermovibrio guaymasensis]|uniref:Lipoprotein n=1 Tax=Thermovibrio guaymasensis TaxID=240167 RepID=A0A420W8G0_9BACT|nr:hypothetical protein [Thermovibrio guaymasensis]RKQ63594.1 hypothetical protein C7457_0468 [Thermovibrio guaymasensis]